MARLLARHAASMRAAALHRHQSQACTMTLAEGIAEYPRRTWSSAAAPRSTMKRP
jgi:hypothetical protein